MDVARKQIGTDGGQHCRLHRRHALGESFDPHGVCALDATRQIEPTAASEASWHTRLDTGEQQPFADGQRDRWILLSLLASFRGLSWSSRVREDACVGSRNPS